MKYAQNNSVDNSNSFVVSPQLKSLHMISNSLIRDESIKMIAALFPNLQLLNLSSCYNISEEGIFHVLKTCSDIRHLNLTLLETFEFLRNYLRILVNYPLKIGFCGFCLGLRFPSNTFILITTGNVPAEFSSGIMNNIRRKSLGRFWMSFTLPV